ncbi:TetR/AcrR family transcriptional regulator [Patulibacter sp. NPDC049589]|uniref:TetR/AcrR family transcriptional regulator n=1 Tax=Patulibacter sp. NPDC049589 TaxID=3154731 RepID=UPI003415B30E
MAQREEIGTGLLGPEARLDLLDGARLPTGRHGLPREVIVENQRARLMGAMVEVVSTHGFPIAVVERIASRAGVSRRTFYEQFSGREEAFHRTYDAEAGRLFDDAVRAAAGARDLAEAVGKGLGAVLGGLARDPAVAKLLIVEVLIVGPEALERRDAHMQRFAVLLEDAAITFLGAPLPRLTAEGLVGAIYDVIYKRVLAGETEDLEELRDDLLAFCLMQLRPSTDPGVG